MDRDGNQPLGSRKAVSGPFFAPVQLTAFSLLVSGGAMLCSCLLFLSAWPWECAHFRIAIAQNNS